MTCSCDIAKITYLVEHGADINAKDDEMKTPVHHIGHSNVVGVVNILIKLGANFNEVDNVKSFKLI